MNNDKEKTKDVSSSDPHPTPNRPFIGKVFAVLGVLFSILFLLNLSAGLVEIPDNLIFIGNLDEVMVSGFLFGCLKYLGIDLIPFGGKKRDKAKLAKQSGED